MYFNNRNIKTHKICGEKQDAFLPQQPLDPKEGFVNLSDNFSLLCATYLSAYLSHQQEKNASAFVLSRNFQNASKLANTNSQRTFRSKDVHMRGRRGAARCGVSGAAAVATSARDRHRCILGMHFEHDNCPIALEFIEICSMHTQLDYV